MRAGQGRPANPQVELNTLSRACRRLARAAGRRIQLADVQLTELVRPSRPGDDHRASCRQAALMGLPRPLYISLMSITSEWQALLEWLRVEARGTYEALRPPDPAAIEQARSVFGRPWGRTWMNGLV